MNIEIDYNLKKHNTFGMDINCSEFVEFSSIEELRTLFNVRKPMNWYVLGGGSNVLFTKDYRGMILHSNGGNIAIISRKDSKVIVRADAGVVWDEFVEFCVDNNLCGAENLSYIPGSVGASPIQNIGAYGVEAKDIIKDVYCYFPENDSIKVLSNYECDFGYRHSIFKEHLRNKVVVYAVEFELSEIFSPKISYGNISKSLKDPENTSLKELREVIVAIRKEKLPDPEILGNGGSFFKNPVVEREFALKLLEKYPEMPHFEEPLGVKIPAAWLIEKAGWKGHRKGNAGVHINQPLVLVNYGKARPQEVISLAHDVIDSVYAEFDIKISPEINII